MDGIEKLALSAACAGWETAEDVRPQGLRAAEARRRYGEATPWVQAVARRMPIHLAALPGGRRIPLLKAMLTTACERDCRYCGFRAGSDTRRVTLQPDEMARAFMQVQRSGVVQGLFLSAGVCGGGARTQQGLLDTCEILRRRLGFRGYLHLKLMPGVERDQARRAMELADRVSVNLEAPSPERLARLAPAKIFEAELLQPLRWVESIRREEPARRGWDGRWASSTTQFVIGAAGESDLEILSTTAWLTRTQGLARAYFEAFTPVPGTPLESHPAEAPLREHRLYQASFLLRDYGFDLEELAFDAAGRLPLEVDPKQAYARAHFAERPVDVNRSPREVLLRVPGIGPAGAKAILAARRAGQRFREVGELGRVGVLAERAAPYILFDGRPALRQMRLW